MFPFIVKLSINLSIDVFSLVFSTVELAFFKSLVTLLLNNPMPINDDFPDTLFWCFLPAASESQRRHSHARNIKGVLTLLSALFNKSDWSTPHGININPEKLTYKVFYSFYLFVNYLDFIYPWNRNKYYEATDSSDIPTRQGDEEQYNLYQIVFQDRKWK